MVERERTRVRSSGAETRSRPVWPVPLSLSWALIASGCGDEEPTPPPPPQPVVFAYPGSPDSLLRAYRDAYEERNAARIDSLLAPDFLFTFEKSERDSFGVGPTWSRAEEMSSTSRFFAGETGVWPDGSPHPPVNDFAFNTVLDPREGSEWTLDEPTGTWSREYSATFVVNYVDFDVDFISGTQLFEVVDMSQIGGPGGAPATGFAIVGWKDLGMEPPGASRAPRHLATWSFLKATFREVPGDHRPANHGDR
jgi:hypothetical protein